MFFCKTFKFDLYRFGDTVNTASRLESYGIGSRIHASREAAEAGTVFEFAFEERGLLDIKVGANCDRSPSSLIVIHCYTMKYLNREKVLQRHSG